MTSLVFLEVLVILVLILVNGFFAGAEIAIIAARRGRLMQQAEAGDRAARMALELADNPNRFLATVQVGITLIGTLAAVFGGARLTQTISEQLSHVPWDVVNHYRGGIALGIVVVGITFFSLLLGELVPKRLALSRAESLARFVARPMHVMALAMRPAVGFMGWATDAVLALVGARHARQPLVSLEDIQHLIERGTTEGILEVGERHVALEALRLGERTVRDVMRPRIEIDALEVNMPPDEVIGGVAMAGFSRLPVYEEDLDHVLGFVYMKDLFRQHYMGWPIDLRKLMRPALFVPETLPLDRLLEWFHNRHTQLAIVLDEYGGTEGMVTLEDVVDELVGEIREEHEIDQEQRIVQRDENSWLVDGMVSIADLIEELPIEPPPPPSARGFSTVAGLILAHLDRLAQVGDRVQWQGLEFEVVDTDGRRIDRVMVRIVDGRGQAGAEPRE